MAAGCGDSGVKHLPDAPPGGQDGPAGPDAPPAEVTVTVTNDGSGYAGVTVYFQDATGAHTDTEMTAADGIATGTVGEGGYVTAVDPYPIAQPEVTTTNSLDVLVTWAQVRPGDHLYFAQGNALDNNVTFTIPVQGGASFYQVSSACGQNTVSAPEGSSSGSGITVPVTFTCANPVGLEVAALDATESNVVGSFYVAPAAYTDQQAVSLSGSSYVQSVTRNYTWNDDNDAEPSFSDGYIDTTGLVFSTETIGATGESPTYTAQQTDIARGTGLDIVDANETDGSGDPTQFETLEWGQGSAAYTTDWGAHRLPSFTSGMSYDAPSKTISWGSTGGAVQPNIVLTEFEAFRTSDSHTTDWEVIGGTAPVRLPTLPTTIYDWNISATDTFSEDNLDVLTVPGNAGDVRANVFGGAGITSVISGATGVVSAAAHRALETGSGSAGDRAYRRLFDVSHPHAAPSKRAAAAAAAKLAAATKPGKRLAVRSR